MGDAPLKSRTKELIGSIQWLKSATERIPKQILITKDHVKILKIEFEAVGILKELDSN